MATDSLKSFTVECPATLRTDIEARDEKHALRLWLRIVPSVIVASLSLGRGFSIHPCGPPVAKKSHEVKTR